MVYRRRLPERQIIDCSHSQRLRYVVRLHRYMHSQTMEHGGLATLPREERSFLSSRRHAFGLSTQWFSRQHWKFNHTTLFLPIVLSLHCSRQANKMILCSFAPP